MNIRKTSQTAMFVDLIEYDCNNLLKLSLKLNLLLKILYSNCKKTHRLFVNREKNTKQSVKSIFCHQ
jgi:hypothetical protein